jgi:hypothetical protein
MANSHGALNGIGFVLLSMLAWLVELNEPGADGNAPRDLPSDEPDAQRVSKSVGTGSAPTPFEPRVRRAPIPEFAARELYDR